MTLRADTLSIDRGGARVLHDVSAALAPGQITAIVGPNGAGKSSLLLALAGLLEPMTGRVDLDGASLVQLAPRQRAQALGYLPQSSDIAWDVAVENLVALGRLPYRDRGTAEIEAALDALELQELRHRPASKLSGGERARALLARVLAGTPQWILADEPLAALDLAHQLHLIAYLETQAKAGKGVVIVLHDLALAMNHADRVLVLDRGRLFADGAPPDALSESTIKDVWGVAMRWIGQPGASALVATG